MGDITQQNKLQIFQKTRQAVLNGELADGVAIKVLIDAGWAEDEAKAHVDLWELVGTLRLVHEERQNGSKVIDLEQAARLLNVPGFGENSDV